MEGQNENGGAQPVAKTMCECERMQCQYWQFVKERGCKCCTDPNPLYAEMCRYNPYWESEEGKARIAAYEAEQEMLDTMRELCPYGSNGCNRTCGKDCFKKIGNTAKEYGRIVDRLRTMQNRFWQEVETFGDRAGFDCDRLLCMVEAVLDPNVTEEQLLERVHAPYAKIVKDVADREERRADDPNVRIRLPDGSAEDALRDRPHVESVGK